ncbi:MAG: methylated-DNA--[protein]-cysteine S-methyltransferase [Myxococcota bacterium]|nr:methylated-DNA--[protein]-cysteine S-methyltransferase [Myxococcota bacterium]
MSPLLPARPATSYALFDSPMGQLRLVSHGPALVAIEFTEHSSPPDPLWKRDEKTLSQAIRQLKEYFSGRRRAFELLLGPTGTPFQLDVWQALQRIPFGQTRSYSEVARDVGRFRAQRAVGTANGRNPLPIVIPCHRVIAADGGLGGYSCGLDKKRFLLSLEQR